ncbi:MAG: spore maturation protein [Oscillospiraceae bacterium]|nr:spore maturation protein [Oscillospiraceae bacterium]
MSFSDAIIPVLVFGIFTYALFKKVNVFDSFVKGAKENIKVAFDLLPTLVLLMLAIGMLKASGALDGFTRLISPVMEAIGFPAECVPLAILKPVSGSGALTVLEEIFKDNTPDSFAGKVASVMAGSTETTFYTLAVYFAATKVKNTRYALVSALLGDLTAIILSCIAVRMIL